MNLITIKIILVAFTLGSASTGLALKWNDLNMTSHVKEALSILDVSEPILSAFEKIKIRQQEIVLGKAGIVAGETEQFIPSYIQNEVIVQEVSKVINQISNYAVKASLTEQELVQLVSASEQLKSILKGEKGDKGDAGISVGFTSPSSTNPGSFGGTTFNSAKDFSSETLNVSGATTLKSLTVSGSGSFNSLTINGIDVVTLTGTQTLTNKTLTSPVITNIAPGGDFTITQNSVTPFVSVNTGAVANTLYLKTGNVGIGTNNPAEALEIGDPALAKGRLQLTGTHALLQFNDASEAVDERRIAFMLDAGKLFIRKHGDDNSNLGNLMVIERSTGNIGIGTSTISARLHSLSTTEQLRLGFDASNYSSFTVSSGGALSINPSGNILNIGGGATATGIRFLENSGNGSNYVGFKAAASLTGDLTWTLPTADGTAGQVLKTDGSGNLSWTTMTEGIQQDFKGLTLRTLPDSNYITHVLLDHADEIVMDTGNRVTNWDDLTARIDFSGCAGCLDTGSEAASTWYEIYAIRKSSDGTKNLLLHRAKDYFLDEGDPSDNSATNLRDDAARTKVGQTFDTDETGPVEFIEFKIFKVGSPTGRVWAELFNTSGGAPTGSPIATSDKLDVSQLPTSSAKTRFIFRSPVTLTAGTTYAVAIAGDFAISAVNYVTARDNNADVYAAGAEYRYDGGTWNVAARDLWFTVYVTRNNTSVTMPSGYDQKAKVGYVYNDSGSNFDPFIASDRRVWNLSELSFNVTATTATLTDLSAFLPPVPVESGWAALNATEAKINVAPVPDGFGMDALGGGGNPAQQGALTGYLKAGEREDIGSVRTETQAAYTFTQAGTATLWVRSYEWGSGGGADLAEEYLVHDESINPGDVVSLTDEALYIEKASNANPNVFGIVSTKPGITLSDWEGATPQNNRAVALTGRVPVKISKENGEVKSGDRLTLSKTVPGHAMKQTQSGQSIGIAMESSLNKEKVLTFVNLSFWTPVMQLSVSQSSDGDIIDTTNEYEVNGFGFLNVKSITSISGKWSIDESGVIIAKKVRLESLEMIDHATREIWCTWIENGEWMKTAGECGSEVTADSGQGAEGNVAGEETTSAEEPIPEESVIEEPAPESQPEPTIEETPTEPEPEPEQQTEEPAPEPPPEE